MNNYIGVSQGEMYFIPPGDQSFSTTVPNIDLFELDLSMSLPARLDFPYVTSFRSQE